MIKSIINQNMDDMTTKLKEIWLVLRRGGYFKGGGCLQFGRGELGWGRRRRRNRGGEGQLSGDISKFADGITDETILSVYPFVICWYSEKSHVTVRRSSFKSIGNCISKITHKNSNVSELLYFSKFYKFSLQFSRYIPTNCVHRYIPIELQTEFRPSVINTNRKMLSVYTDIMIDRIYAVCNDYRKNISVSKSVGFCRISSSEKNLGWLDNVIKT